MIPTTNQCTRLDTRKRLRLTLRGTLQGVGFRPFVYRLAQQLSITGWIKNTPKGVLLEIEGTDSNLTFFQQRLRTQSPPAATIHDIKALKVQEEGAHDFTIQPSQQYGITRSVIAPDLATCDDCLQEINDPHSRRFRYPFTTCTQCGPRYSVVTQYPYDRNNTTMKAFPLCHDCQLEYEDMSNRRFHAEAMACPRCGPQVSFVGNDGIIPSQEEDALLDACSAIRDNKILAVKGLGGFQLWVNTLSDETVQELRLRKHRPRKPFAVLFPSLDQLRDHCLVSAKEESLLRSPESPIVLLERKNSSPLTSTVAPDNPYIGAMLPYTPLHHLLMKELGHPVVATSGNLSEEPILIDEQEALRRLKGIADAFLIHNRPIARQIDDSVVRLTDDEQMILRRARGYVPIPLTFQKLGAEDKPGLSVLAVGGHLKNTVAVTTQDQVLLSQHVGDLSTAEANSQFKQTVTNQLSLFNVHPHAIACDRHPDYQSTLYANDLGKQFQIPVIPIQHHHAHIVSCMAEHGLEGPVLGVAWDGAGYGLDGTLWGGEFLSCDYSGFTRIAHLRPFHLPGGEICMYEPYRVALSLLYEIFGEDVLQLELPPLHALGSDLSNSLVTLLKKNVNCPITTSMGRLFDAISSILGLRHFSTFEGEAAMALEFVAQELTYTSQYQLRTIPISLRETQKKSLVIDWRPFVREIVLAYLDGKPLAQISKEFHHYLVNTILQITKKLPYSNVVLAGGVFQNTSLTSLAKRQLQASGYDVYTNTQFPTNDGGLAIGQSVVAQNLLHVQQGRT